MAYMTFKAIRINTKTDIKRRMHMTLKDDRLFFCQLAAFKHFFFNFTIFRGCFME